MRKSQKKHDYKIAEALNTIVDLFKSGNVPRAISVAIFPPYTNIPSSHWSLTNRLIMVSNNTNDSRGFHQWKKAGRYVKKGAKSFTIVAPKIIKKTLEYKNEATGAVEQEERNILVGYIPVPVFAAEQTEGKKLEYEQIELPKLPLMEKAKQWGICVKGVAFLGAYYGSYEQRGNTETIKLATPSEKTWFHELAHSAHARIKKLKPQQDPHQEIVAELAAQTLAQLVGTELGNTLGNSYLYIKSYAKELNKDIGQACIELLVETEKVLNLILEL